MVVGHSFSMTSEILGEERPYLIHLPDSYDESTNPVAVMYLLDGGGHFLHTAGIVSYLSKVGRIPPIMIVAIPNTTDRTRDLTPTIEKDEEAKKNFPTAGGADKMLAFITDELIPHIDTSYRTNAYRILVGHSFGGIFAVNAWLKEPTTFDAYISISPSMWWDKQNLVDKAEAFLDSKPPLEGYFYMTMGNEGKEMLGGAMKLAALLEEKASDSLEWDFKVMKEEDHGSVPHRSTYYGLEAIFKDWFKVDVGDLFLSGGMEAVNQHFTKVSRKLGYEIKPSESEINQIGYRFMADQRFDKALEVFQANVKRYPSSFNVYDSMAEAFMKMEDNESAIKHYKKSLEIHPGNDNAVKMLKEMDVEYDPMSMTVDVAEHKLKKYEGRYEAPLGVVAIQVAGGKLTLEMLPMVEKEELFAFGNDQFLLKSQNVSIRFERSEKKEVVGFEAQMGIGQLLQAKKVE